MNMLIIQYIIYFLTILFLVVSVYRFITYRNFIKMTKDSYRAAKYITSALGWLFLALTSYAIGIRIY